MCYEVTSSCTSCKAAVEVDRPDQPSRIKEIAFKKQTELEDIYARSHVSMCHLSRREYICYEK
ncbi:hypothetical protein YC2023_075223 [Brassica napus]